MFLFFLSWFCFSLLLRITHKFSGIRFEIEKSINLDLFEKPRLFFHSHASGLDVTFFIQYLSIPVKFIAKKELFNIPFVGTLFRSSGVIPID